MINGQTNMTLNLTGISEIFKFNDFCTMVKTGAFSFLRIKFARNVSDDYKNAFKAAVKEMQKNWPSNIVYPTLKLFDY